jgi:hypothetical protein
MTSNLIAIVGVQGSGKSHFARSARECGPTAVALIDPKEVSFYGGDATLIWDPDWRPHLGAGVGNLAGGWLRLLAWTAEQQKSKAEFVVYDTGTEATRLAEHEYLKMQNVFAPGDLDYGRGYTGPESLVWGLVTEWRRLAMAGKTVIVTFHAAMKEMEGVGTPRKVRNMTGEEELRFDEQLLPVVSGRNLLAQTIGTAFDLWLYTVPVGYDAVLDPKLPEAARAKLAGLARREYYLTAVPDAVRPAKHSVRFKAGFNATRIPNNVRALLAGVER